MKKQLVNLIRPQIVLPDQNYSFIWPQGFYWRVYEDVPWLNVENNTAVRSPLLLTSLVSSLAFAANEPSVALTAPADAATGVAINKTIAATFSEAMDRLTITIANFTVAGVTGTVTYNAISNIATFTPSSNLVAGITYTATITTGVKDLAGNALAVNKVTGTGLHQAQ